MENSIIWLSWYLSGITKLNIFKAISFHIFLQSQCAKSQFDWPCCSSDNSWFKNLKIWLNMNIFDRTQLKIYKQFSTFFETKYIWSCYFNNSYLRYSWFKNFTIWLAENIFDHTLLKLSIHLLSSVSLYQNAKNHHNWPGWS